MKLENVIEISAGMKINIPIKKEEYEMKARQLIGNDSYKNYKKLSQAVIRCKIFSFIPLLISALAVSYYCAVYLAYDKLMKLKIEISKLVELYNLPLIYKEIFAFAVIMLLAAAEVFVFYACSRLIIDFITYGINIFYSKRYGLTKEVKHKIQYRLMCLPAVALMHLSGQQVTDATITVSGYRNVAQIYNRYVILSFSGTAKKVLRQFSYPTDYILPCVWAEKLIKETDNYICFDFTDYEKIYEEYFSESGDDI